MKIDLLGIHVNTETRSQVLDLIEQNLAHNKTTFIVTPYSEFFQRCFRDQKFRSVLNSADIAIPDGISTVWLAHYLSLPLKSQDFYFKVIEAFFQMIWSGLQIIFAQNKIHDVIPQRIPGSDFFWDLVKLASRKKLKIFLLGGHGDTPQIVKQKVLEKYPNASIVGVSNTNPSDPNLIRQIKESSADLLLVAFGPGSQEIWIYENLYATSAKIAIGLGGTFDYIAGKRKLAPTWIRKTGLEWLYRLITQPYRVKRIWNATYGFLLGTIRFKVWQTTGLRKNVVGVIINARNEIFIASRILDPKFASIGEGSEHWQFPQGGANDHENLESAILREIQEETGISRIKVLGQAEQTHFYVWNNTIRPLLFNPFKYRGQQQTIFFLRFEGRDSEIQIDNEHKEFLDWKWVSISELEGSVHPYRLPLVKIVLAEIDKYIE
jgi:N-acetylglucosaminyldiphosphoundecaprenol N-acetyl-beta-D-mannosaminyltransferase